MAEKNTFFGPEVCNYALLNEAIRQGKLKPAAKIKQPRKRKGLLTPATPCPK